MNGTKRLKQLVCAPSNAACDVITKRLLSNLPKAAKILRLYAMCTSPKSIMEEFRTAKIVNLIDRDIYMPSKEEIAAYDIVVCTTVTAGRFDIFIFIFLSLNFRIM